MAAERRAAEPGYVLDWADQWLAQLDDPTWPDPDREETRALVMELVAEVVRGQWLERKAKARGWPGWE